MPNSTAYLVVRRDDGFGDVFPLTSGERYTMGRAPSCRIVLKDDMCSREHAEVYRGGSRWRVRDLNSLNGTKVNGERLVDGEWELSPHDEVALGRTRLLFVNDMSQLPDLPAVASDGIEIKKRLGQTRFLTPLPADHAEKTDTHADETPRADSQHTLSHDLALLYRLALEMGAAATYGDLVHVVLDGLLEAIPAEVGAVLTVLDGGELEVTAHRHRDPANKDYVRVSEYVSGEVLRTKEAVLAEDVTRDRYLRNRESLTDLSVTSLICAPVAFDGRVLGLIHLYCIDPHRTLEAEDLEFAVAVANQLGAAAHHIQKQESLTAENRNLRDQLKLESDLVGSAAPMKEIESQMSRVAGTNATVLIRGESGVGKELVARAIHYSSRRRDGPFVCLNCAALTETLLESELFGHEKGSFTGATDKKIGKFEAADGGTIFLDEIGEMNPGTQAKLLRILEGHPFERVGGSVPIKVNVRVVAATNQPLEHALTIGQFRKDLFFRLQVVQIDVPPLRDRKSDIPVLAEHFLKRFVQETGRRIRGFTPAALAKMQGYHWPGNVRELRNVVERAVALSQGPMLDAADVWLSALDAGAAPGLAPAAETYKPVSLEDVEKEHIRRTLEHVEWNKSQAAAILNIERSTLDRKIKAYELKK
jgi:transcriptional regulator with GAF, ATPase, and Fis domain